MEAKVTQILTGGIERYAKKYGVEESHVQLNISLLIADSVANARYRVLRDYKPVEETTVNEIRGVKMDLIGMGNIINNFILNKLISICDQQGIEYENVSAMVLLSNELDEDGEKQVVIWVYNGGAAVRSLTVDELLS